MPVPPAEIGNEHVWVRDVTVLVVTGPVLNVFVDGVTPPPPPPPGTGERAAVEVGEDVAVTPLAVVAEGFTVTPLATAVAEGVDVGVTAKGATASFPVESTPPQLPEQGIHVESVVTT